MVYAKRLVLSGSLCIIGLPSSVWAQDNSDSTTLPAIEVTASKRTQDLSKVDSSVSVVTGEELEKRGINSVDGLQEVFPGLSIASRGTRIYSNFTVRGLSSPDYFNPTVQVYVDGAPQTSSAFSQPLQNVERVEFLRGPQGALYGANAYGGVINIITKKKNEDHFYLQTTISSKEPSVEFGGTAVVVPKMLFLDFSAGYSYFSGDIRDSTTGHSNINSSRDGSGRATLRYAPEGGDFDASLSYSREILKSHEEVYVLQKDVESRTYSSGFYGAIPYLERTVDNLSGQMNYHFGDFTLSSITSWQESDVTRDFASGAGSWFVWPQNDKMFTQELRLSYDGAMFAGTAGLWYSHDDFTSWKNGYPGYYGDSINNVQTDSVAAFGELTWHATDKLDVTGGLRGTYDHSTIDASRDDLYSNGQGFGFDNSASFKSIQPKFSVGYQLTPDVRLFATVSRGYKPGGFNHSISSSIDSASYHPEYDWNFETGVRSSLFNDDVNLSASLYHIRSTNKQIYVGQIGSQFIRNVGKANSTGIELEAVWRATNKLTISSNAAYGRSDFTEFTDPYTGATYKGNRVPYAPDATLRTNVAYLLTEDMFGGSLTANGAANYSSKVYFDEANSTGQSAFATFDTSLDFAKKNGFSASVYVKNIADKRYKTSGYIKGDYELGTLGTSRTFGLTLRQEF
jgi:pesticin/yersiniabactin receptor